MNKSFNYNISRFILRKVEIENFLIIHRFLQMIFN